MSIHKHNSAKSSRDLEVKKEHKWNVKRGPYQSAKIRLHLESCAQFWVLLPWKKGFCLQNEGYLGSKEAEEWNEGPREVESVTLCIPERNQSGILRIVYKSGASASSRKCTAAAGFPARCKKTNFMVKMIKYQHTLPREYLVFIPEDILNLTEQMLEQSDLTLKLTLLSARR